MDMNEKKLQKKPKIDHQADKMQKKLSRIKRWSSHL